MYNQACTSIDGTYKEVTNKYAEITNFSLKSHVSNIRCEINDKLAEAQKKAFSSSAFKKENNPYVIVQKEAMDLSEQINSSQPYMSSLCRSHPDMMIAASSSALLLPFWRCKFPWIISIYSQALISNEYNVSHHRCVKKLALSEVVVIRRGFGMYSINVWRQSHQL